MSTYRGSTLRTLIGCLAYVFKHTPGVVIMENVLGVNQLLEHLERFFLGICYKWVHTRHLVPDRFKLPNSRPRVYMIAVREKVRQVLFAARSIVVALSSSDGSAIKHRLVAQVRQGTFVTAALAFLHSVLERFSRMPMVRMEELLLDRQHPHLAKVFGSPPATCSHYDQEARNAEAVWHCVHETAFRQPHKTYRSSNDLILE